MDKEKVYRKMYYELLGSVTEAVEIIEQDPQLARLKLEVAELHCREIYVKADPKLRRERKKEREKYGSFATIF